jgi:hypothetical protein
MHSPNSHQIVKEAGYARYLPLALPRKKPLSPHAGLYAVADDVVCAN